MDRLDDESRARDTLRVIDKQTLEVVAQLRPEPGRQDLGARGVRPRWPLRDRQSHGEGRCADLLRCKVAEEISACRLPDRSGNTTSTKINRPRVPATDGPRGRRRWRSRRESVGPGSDLVRRRDYRPVLRTVSTCLAPMTWLGEPAENLYCLAAWLATASKSGRSPLALGFCRRPVFAAALLVSGGRLAARFRPEDPELALREPLDFAAEDAFEPAGFTVFSRSPFAPVLVPDDHALRIKGAVAMQRSTSALSGNRRSGEGTIGVAWRPAPVPPVPQPAVFLRVADCHFCAAARRSGLNALPHAPRYRWHRRQVRHFAAPSASAAKFGETQPSLSAGTTRVGCRLDDRALETGLATNSVERRFEFAPVAARSRPAGPRPWRNRVGWRRRWLTLNSVRAGRRCSGAPAALGT